ncbi:MAG TPA: Holliday junction branch migration protein RuvA [Burkholderiaceae bacterium]|jgi:Holliday junction DNA helicase RuvA|nr:Holliday junction branch migration protein RuvA [Burkholderiaceae bacterium]
MIGRLTGTLAAKHPPGVLVDVNGVGYELDVPMSTFYNLPALGERVTLLTHLAVREDAHQLYGFASATERQTFRELIRISGIGARTALSVLSGLSVDELAQAVALQDGSRLTRIPGIGKKTAERLLLELKGRLAPALAGAETPSGASDPAADIVRALLALGYSEKEASAAARLVPAGSGVSDGIRFALKSLAKA